MKRLSLLVVVLAACGCSGEGELPDTYMVRGKVFYHDEPVEGASVSFLCDGAPRAAIGITDRNGQFFLTTFVSRDGAVPGDHLVTVVKIEPEIPDNAPKADPLDLRKEGRGRKYNPYKYYTDMMKVPDESEDETAAINNGEMLLPEKYSTFETTDIRFEVTTNASQNNYTIELVD